MNIADLRSASVPSPSGASLYRMTVIAEVPDNLDWAQSLVINLQNLGALVGSSDRLDEARVYLEEAKRRGLSRSGLLAQLLESEKVREQTRGYIDQYGWDVTEDEEAWRSHQKRRMAEEYSDDQW